MKFRAIEYDTRPSHLTETNIAYNSSTGQLKSMKSRRLASSTSIVAEFHSMFLPAGYPTSVTDEYLSFQCWDTLQAMSSYLRGVLATQSVLQSVGVGSDSATPLAAAIQWIFRDGAGMLGGLFFAYCVGPRFDANVKFWRLYADLINDVGLTLDMVAPLFPIATLHILTCSSICKAMCGVAAGSTRSSLTAHFAKQDNMADVAAKEGSQETAVTLIGLIVGMYFAKIANSSSVLIWISFALLTLLHVIANYNAVRCLRIPTINQQRASLLIDAYDRSTTMSIAGINAREAIWLRPSVSIIMGARIQPSIFSRYSTLDLYQDENYVLLPNDDMSCVYVCLKRSAMAQDELKAYFNAHRLMTTGRDPESCYQSTRTEFHSFVAALEDNGWQTHRYLLECLSWRYDFA